MVGRLDEAFRFGEAALNLRSQRQQVLASNMANGDTPNYKARDFDFNTALKNVSDQRPTEVLPMASTSKDHLQGSRDLTPGGAQLQYRNPAQGSIDGNTVDMDVERNQFMDNSLRYEATLTFVAGQVKGLLAAIQGGQ